MSERIYLVHNIKTKEDRLVRASNQASARSHVAKATLTVEVASQTDLVRLLKAGAGVEGAGVTDADDGEQESI
jgi:hypothetical protein